MTPPRLIWAYTYRLVPPQSAERLKKIKALLEKERRAAVARAGTFEGRLVVDERVAHILVLSDSPELDREANQRIESALREIDAGFAVTVPLAVNADDPHDARAEDPSSAPADAPVAGAATTEDAWPADVSESVAAVPVRGLPRKQ